MQPKVKPGDPLKITAETFNTMLDAAMDFRRRQQSSKRPAPLFPAGPQRCEIRVKNTTDATLPRFSVVDVSGGVVFSPDDNENGFKEKPCLVAGTPTSSTDWMFAILVDSIPKGRIGRAMMLGIVPVQVEMNDAGDTYAGPKDGDSTKLTSGTEGPARIIYKAGDTGTVWALVQVGGQPGGGMEDGSEDGQLWVWKYDPTATPPVAEWILLTPPAVFSVLVFDPTAAAGEKVKWVAPADCTT